MNNRKDPNENEIMQGVKLRHKVDTIVKNDFSHAYELAKSIKHPWYKCQALAAVADCASKTSIKSILLESFESALNCHDQNRRVSVACWPLRVAISNNLNDLANSFLDQCISQINQEMDPISKWCAAAVVHTIKEDSNLLKNFYNTFVNATIKGHGWRVEREIKCMLSDEYIKKDKQYIAYLSERQNAILNWKNDHAQKKSS